MTSPPRPLADHPAEKHERPAGPVHGPAPDPDRTGTVQPAADPGFAPTTPGQVPPSEQAVAASGPARPRRTVSVRVAAAIAAAALVIGVALSALVGGLTGPGGPGGGPGGAPPGTSTSQDGAPAGGVTPDGGATTGT